MKKRICLMLLVTLLFFGLISVIKPLYIYAGTGSEITSLDTPTGLGWEEESTATAKWDAVENANYYLVNLHIYDTDYNYLTSVETGTTDIEIDLQQEVYSYVQNKNINSLIIRFSVIARYYNISNDSIINSPESSQSSEVYFLVKNIQKIEAPTDVNLTDDYIATWSKRTGTDYYHFDIYYKYNGRINHSSSASFNCSSSSSNRCTANSSGIVSFDLREFIQAGYKNFGYTGEVEVSFKVQAQTYSENGNYISSDFSVLSNEVSYSHASAIKIEAPTDVNLTDDYIATWSKRTGTDYYHFDIYYKYNGRINHSSSASFNCSSSSSNRCTANSSGIVSFNLREFIQAGYKNFGYTGEVEVSFKVKAQTYSENENYISSDFSVLSNEVSYSHAPAIKIEAPTDVNLTDDYIATWSKRTGTDYYHFDIYYKYNGRINHSSSASFNCSSSSSNRCTANSSGIVSFNLREFIQAGYKSFGYTGVVEVSFKVKAQTYSENENYISSDFSVLSNIIYYSPNGSTVINEITLSPNEPVIAVGRSIYIGKTIDPSNALYSVINWSSSNNSIVSIDSMGKITGVKKGKSTITAQINNATQTAEVNVYEIKSTLDDTESKTEIIDAANDVIESIIIDGDTSNTDIQNVEEAVNKIETGAKNGNEFSVDINTTVKDKEEFNSIESEIKAIHSDMEIAGGYDVNVEISHKDSNNNKIHIGNITEFENDIKFNVEILNDIPELAETQTREYKLMRYHDGVLEDVETTVVDNEIETSSDKFSEFILLYRDTDIRVTGINVMEDNLTLLKGKSVVFGVIIIPYNAANKNVTTTSSDESIVRVEGNVIYAVERGTATVTVTTVDGRFSKEITVTVIDPKVLGISLTSNSYDVSIGEGTFEIGYEVLTQDNPTYNVVFSSSNPNIVSVDNEGNATIKDVGNCVITITVGEFSKDIQVNINSKISGVKLNKNELFLNIGESYKLQATIIPSNTTDDRTLTFRSGNADIVSVDDEGNVTAIKRGTASISVMTSNGKIDVCDVTVLEPKVLQINTDKNVYNVDINNYSFKLNPEVIVQDNASYTLKYTSADESVASVDSNGTVYLNKVGSTNITVKANDVTREVTVNVSEFIINDSDINVTVDGKNNTHKINYSLNGNINKIIIWSVSDPSIASVSSDGVVSGLQSGYTSINGKVVDTGYELNIGVNVTLGYDTANYYYVPKDGSDPVFRFTKKIYTGEKFFLPNEYVADNGFNATGLYEYYYPYGATYDYEGTYYNGSFSDYFDIDRVSSGTGNTYNLYVYELCITVENIIINNYQVDGDYINVDFSVEPKNAYHTKLESYLSSNLEYVSDNYSEYNLDSYQLRLRITGDDVFSYVSVGTYYRSSEYIYFSIFKSNNKYEVYKQEEGNYTSNYEIYYNGANNARIKLNDTENANRYKFFIDIYDYTAGEYIVNKQVCDNLNTNICNINNIKKSQSYSISVTIVDKINKTYRNTSYYYYHSYNIPWLTTEPNSYNSIKLTLNGNVAEDTTVKIYRSLENSEYSYIGSFEKGQKEYIDSNLIYNSNYSYKLLLQFADGSTSNLDESNCYSGYPSISAPVVNATATSSNSIKVTWDKVDGATKYYVNISTNINSYGKDYYIKANAKLEKTISKLKANKKYYIRVSAEREYKKNHFSSNTSEVFEITTPPTASSFSLSKFNFNNVNVNIAGNGGTQYEIYRSTNSKKGFVKVTTVNNSGIYTDSNLVPNKTYYYKIKTCNVYGCGNYSSAKSIKISLGSTKISITKNSDASMTVKYNSVSGAVGYEIYQSTNKKKWTKVGETDLLLYQNIIPLNKKYYYKVRAFAIVDGKKYYSGYSNIKDVKVTIGKPSVILSKTSTAIKVNYSNVSGASGYEIYRSTNSKKGFKKINTLSELEYLDAINVSKTYYYKVRAYKEVNGKKYYGSYSKVMNIKFTVVNNN